MAGFPPQLNPQMMAMLAARQQQGGAAPPQPTPPGAPIASPVAGGNPGIGPSLQNVPQLIQLMSSPAAEKAIENLTKFQKLLGAAGPQGGNMNRAHRGGMRLDAAQAPGMTIAPQIAQQAGIMNPQQLQQLIAMLAQMRAQPPSAAPPLPAPPQGMPPQAPPMAPR